MPKDVTFTPLYGAHGGGPVSFLLQLGDFNILLDCGWGDPFDAALLKPLLAVVGRIDAVLLSHPDLEHIGALPSLVGCLGASVPVYATGATHKMGQMCLYDAYLIRRAGGDFTAFTLDDVDAAFARITQLRFRQEAALPGRGAGITVTPLAAGRLLGGAVWRIAAAGEEYVYALGFNHRRERHLAGTALDSAFLRPALLVSDVGSVGRPPSDRERSERALVDHCLATLRADGNVLIPMDAAGRALEVALVLERHWGERKLTYPVALVGPMAHTTLEFARSQLEWMNEALVRSFGHNKDNPFSLRYVKPCASLGELRKLPPGPRVVLATAPSLAAGAARTLFADWAPDPRCAVLLLLEPDPGSLAAEALQAAGARDAAPSGAPLPVLQVMLGKRVPLSAAELEEHNKAEEERRAAQAAAAGVDAMDVDGAGTSLDGGSPRSVRDLQQPQPTRASIASIGHLTRGSAGRAEVLAAGGVPLEDTMLPSALDEGGAAVECLIEGFEPPEGTAAPMFPSEDAWEAVQYDEYGEVVDLTALAEAEAGDTHTGRLGRALASEAAAEHRGEGGAGFEEGSTADGAPDEAAALAGEAPSKIVQQERAVTLASQVARLDFEGRSDGRSVHTMVSHIAARHTVLVHGAAQAVGALAARLGRELEGLEGKVYTPVAGEAIEITADPAFEVVLGDTLARAADMHAVGGYELTWVDGVVGPPDADDHAASAVAGGGGDNEAAAGSAQLCTLLPATGDARAGGVFIGDVRLSELKRALNAAGIAADFHGGALHCAGEVIVRRHGEGGTGLVLEGSVTEGYYKVREVVYAQHHIC